MPTIRINGIPYNARVGERLSELLARNGIAADHPCGGRGVCRKCTVSVNGREELSCRYVPSDGDVILLARPEAIAAEGAVSGSLPLTPSDGCDLALDLGTTTLALAAVDRATGALLRVVTANNPQRAFGADVMSRIDYARTHGVASLQAPLCTELDRMITELRAVTTNREKTGENSALFTTSKEITADSGIDRTTSTSASSAFDRLFVAGNTTMLHLLLGVDPTPMGAAPYTPAFLDERRVPAARLGLHGVREVIALPGIAAFVGADLVAGAYRIGLPPEGKYRLLVDLGTNAEILLWNRERLLCTAAAAGPCFEGASISCGMSATPGAICAYEPDGSYTTIGNAPPRGLCGTGLVDAVAALLEREIIDETGYMDNDIFYLADAVFLTREDVRQYQLAKSAVAAALDALLHRTGVDYTAVDRLCIAGGFAAKLNVPSAVRTGLLPAPLADRCVPVGNTSLLGTARYAALGGDLAAITGIARYIDLASDPYFSERFMEGMLFE